jgi:hypothetical protein
LARADLIMLRPMVRFHLAPRKSPDQRPFFSSMSRLLSSAESRLWSNFTLAHPGIIPERASAQSTFFVPSTAGRRAQHFGTTGLNRGAGRDGEVPGQAAEVASSDGGRIEVHHSCSASAVVNGGRVPPGLRASSSAICMVKCALGSSKLGVGASYWHLFGDTRSDPRRGALWATQNPCRHVRSPRSRQTSGGAVASACLPAPDSLAEAGRATTALRETPGPAGACGPPDL